MLGAYVGAGNYGGMAKLSALVGYRVRYASDFLGSTSWSALVNPSWFLARWKHSGYSVNWSVPMLPTNPTTHRPEGTLIAGAQGKYNHYFVTLSRRLVAGGQGHAIIRLGWEFNGEWWPWSQDTCPRTVPTCFAAYWRHVVRSMDSVPGAHYQFEWTPIYGAQDPMVSWPGAQYVSIIGLDVYDRWWPKYPIHTVCPVVKGKKHCHPAKDTALVWSRLRTLRTGLDWAVDFAAQQHKPLAIPEWGVSGADSVHGGGDDAAFVNDMAAFLHHHPVVDAIYWDFGPSASLKVNPAVATAIRQDFSAKSTPRS